MLGFFAGPDEGGNGATPSICLLGRETCQIEIAKEESEALGGKMPIGRLSHTMQGIRKKGTERRIQIA